MASIFRNCDATDRSYRVIAVFGGQRGDVASGGKHVRSLPAEIRRGDVNKHEEHKENSHPELEAPFPNGTCV